MSLRVRSDTSRPQGPLAASESVVEGRLLERGFVEGCDVVVVGSGSGGSVVATVLAEAGQRVIVLEEGPYFTPAEYGSFRPTDTMRRLYREAGLLSAFGIGATPIIALTAGRCVGGSSVLTGGVCFRVPSEVHDRWARELGLGDLSEQSFEPAYAEVERRIGVHEVPASARSRSTVKFVEGAERLGITMHPTRRNTEGCEGNARCNFGCPARAKMSVDVSYLPAAIAKGARVVADALVERIDIEGGRAVGVSGRLIGGADGSARHPFRVRARAVVVACGTLHTPLLLFASGFGRRGTELGRHVTLHPAVRVSALFDEDLHGWDGALQSVYSDHFAGEGITLVGVYSPVNVLAAALPGVGPAHRRRFSQMARHAVFGAMVHDEGGGRIRRGPGREPILTYRMAERDLARLRRSIDVLGEIALAAGAREVYLPIFGTEPVRSLEMLRALRNERVDARRLECIAFHPLGSARMATEPRGGVVRPSGETFDLEGLYVADGSVLPTSIGVNSQVPIMAMATRIAWGLREKLARRAA